MATLIGSGSTVIGNGGMIVGTPNAPAASAPDAMAADTNFTATDAGTGGDFVLTLLSAPANNRSAITGYEYRVGSGGSWTSAGTLASPLLVTDEVTDSVATDIYCRAVNGVGNGVDGTADSVTTSVSNARTQAQVELLYANGSTYCGLQSAPTKTVGVDSLPSGASLSTDIVTVSGDDVTFDGWDFTGYRIVVNSGSTGLILTNCLIASTPGHTGWAGNFNLRVNAGAVVAEVSWCDFVGSGAFGGEAALVKEVTNGTNGAGTTVGKITMFERNRLLQCSNDCFKMGSNGTVRDNYFGPSKHFISNVDFWDSGTTYNTGNPTRYLTYLFTSKVDGNIGNTPPSSKTSNTYWQNLDPHSDGANPAVCIGTGKEIYGNYFNRSNEHRLTEDDADAYGHGVNSSFFPVRNNNALDVPMESVNFHHNIVAGGTTLQSYPINLGSAGTTGAALWNPHTVENNWLQPNTNGQIFYPGYAAAGHTVQNNDLTYVQGAPG